MSKITLAGLPAVAAAAMSVAAQAATLDQSDVPATGPILLPYAGTSLEYSSSVHTYGQTFTAGRTGELTRIDLGIAGSPYVQESGGFTVSLEQTPGAALASTHINLSQVPRTFTVRWSDIPEFVMPGAGVPVVANQTYRIIITMDPGAGSGWTGWLYEVDGQLLSYAEGHGFNVTQYGEYAIQADYAFRTYVQSAGVPESKLWGALVLGFTGLGLALRQRRYGGHSESRRTACRAAQSRSTLGWHSRA